MARARRLVVSIAISLALAGCSATAGSQDDALAEADSPLGSYLREVMNTGLARNASTEQQQAFHLDQERRQQELIARCMTGQGFDYVPDTGQHVSWVGDGEDENWQPDDRAWVEQYGYGLTTNPYQLPANLPKPDPSGSANANDAYLDSLTEAERQAYQKALWGTLDDDADYDWTKAGCFGAAQHQVQGENQWELKENQPIVDAIQKFWATQENDPAYAALDADWSACMDQAGYSGFRAQAEARQSIAEQLDAYQANPPAGQSPSYGTPGDPVYATLTRQELTWALADLTCREQTDYRQRQLRIRFAAEAQFIADHQAELDAMKARAEQAQP
ncbi:MAG: hypothetical protein VB080_09835 [Propionicimonas sp.]|uniref:hypothetical protein n=1 Tax=Propionicimonas sp. TaxID=1955623 RepID=UPI002B1F95AC|nr:hypothetical protein [Propionicimonas sp.]MEA4944719.1 hypothetical protein [Propionicimonas sp.]